jgi:hypothetical protein
VPGWYIHMEAAKQTVDRLRAGQVPTDFPAGVDPVALGDVAHKWRNYLALGAIGPDIAALFPDFRPPIGSVIANVVDWYLEVWDVIDAKVVEPWETYAEPALTGFGDILNTFTGDTLHELGLVLQNLGVSVHTALVDLLARHDDWFGKLQSGVPQGIEESLFTWFDMFHYRRTSRFTQALFRNAGAHPTKSEQFTAFAVGWASHCATDVVGHSFVNAKCGGPYRLHWQRHHLIEGHMDAAVYDDQHHGAEPYGELDTAALHFRLAFRHRDDAPYNGADDAPAYDYFDGDAGPPYDSADTPTANSSRDALWDLDTGTLPAELSAFLVATIREVYVDGMAPEDTPQVLTDVRGDFHAGPTGAPNAQVIEDTFALLYTYFKQSSTKGYSPRRPTPPQVFGEHPFPSPPGFADPVEDDPARGGDVGDDDELTLMDVIAAVIGVAVYIADVALWLISLPASAVTSLVTYPVRELLYQFAVVPLYSLYIAARRPLVMAGFVLPKPEEIDIGLIQLGRASGATIQGLAQALAAPTGAAGSTPIFDEPSGRLRATDPFGADSAYPRQVVTDPPQLIEQLSGHVGTVDHCTANEKPSEYLRPWLYPNKDNGGDTVGWEAPLARPGPFVQGDVPTRLMGQAPGSAAARRDFEGARTPAETDQIADRHLRKNEHLGDVVEYGVYMVGRLAGSAPVPDFNLDADRGYGYLAWEWDRDPAHVVVPEIGRPVQPNAKYRFSRPCTVPEGYCQKAPNDIRYDPTRHLALHYDPDAGPDECQPIVPVSDTEVAQAGIPPQGVPKGGRARGR